MTTPTQYALLHTHGNSCFAEVLEQGEKTSVINTGVSKSEIVLTSRLTFLTLVEIQGNGEAREVNPMGEEPDENFYIGNVDRTIEAQKWLDAQSRLRCLPVMGMWKNDDNGMTSSPVQHPPGSLWLAHEVENRWVVVKRWEEKK